MGRGTFVAGAVLVAIATAGILWWRSPADGPATPPAAVPAPAPVTGRLRVRVEGPAGPAAGARVEAWRKEHRIAVATADGAGAVFFPALPAGDLRLVARRGDALGENRWNPVPPGGLREAEVRIGPAEAVTGRVVRASDGTPVAGAEVELFHCTLLGFDLKPFLYGHLADRRGGAVTAADGSFRIPDLPPGTRERALMRIAAEGLRTTLREPDAEGPIVLAPGATLRGRVTDDVGRGIANARVTAVPAEWAERQRGYDVVSPGYREERYPTLRAGTDREGRYEIAGAWRGDHYALAVCAEGFANGAIEDRRAPAADADFRLAPGESSPWGFDIENILAEVHADGERGEEEVAGVVVRPDGTPLAGARVVLRSPRRWTVTEADGSFRIDQLPAGPGRLELRLPSGPEEVGEAEVEIPGDPVRITALRTAVRATVVLPSPSPAVIWRALTVGDTARNERYTFDLPRGETRIPVEIPVLSGEFSVRFEVYGFRLAEWSGRVADREVVDVGEVRIEPFRSVRGRVVDKAGDPIAGADVSIGGSDARSGPSGEFRLTLSWANSDYVWAHAEGYLPLSRSLAADEEEVLVRLRPGVPVRVAVRDDEGNPLARVRVRLLREEDPAGRSRSDPRTGTDGTVRLLSEPGSYEVEAETPWGAKVSRAVVLDLARPPGTIELVIPR